MEKATIVGSEMFHSKFGNVLVVSKKERSRTIFNVKQLDRGKGWNDEMKRYDGYSVKNERGIIWCRGENKDYGKINEVHIKELKGN